ncbi:MAG TPA: patatin-like phospholipase family protein [Rhizomicrobium sp.]|nr:patatin-like phospholipase family protein [Rhizomicrobium sp.]
MAKPRIGLALGSGAARGWAHIGVIDALKDAGIEPDIVCGTSMGALVGAAYVAGRLPGLRAWAEAATWREVVGLIDVRLSGGGLVDGKLIVKFLRGLGIEKPIESHSKRYAAVATDLASGREIWLQTGPIHDVVRASIAMPGILSPGQVNGQWLTDGGLTNPVPVSVCRALGADVIIAVNLNGDLVGKRFEPDADAAEVPLHARASGDFLEKLLSRLPAGMREHVGPIAPRLFAQGPLSPGYFDVLANSLNIMQDHITRTRLAGEPPHVQLVPRLNDFGWMEFNRAKEAIAEGRACVEQALPMLERYT